MNFNGGLIKRELKEVNDSFDKDIDELDESEYEKTEKSHKSAGRRSNRRASKNGKVVRKSAAK